MGSMVERYLAARETAAAMGDHNLVSECEFQLRRFGWTPEQTPAAAEAVEARADAEAQPAGRAKARR